VPLLRESRGALTAFALVICLPLLLVSVNLGIPGQELLQSLRFHIVAVLLGLVILLFATGAWFRAVLFLVVFGLSAGQSGLVVYRQQTALAVVSSQPSRPLLRMLSFNLLQTNKNGEAITAFIEGSGADIVLLLEGGPVTPHLAQLEKTYPYRVGCQRWCDMVLMSRTPLTDASMSSLNPVWANRLVTAHTVIDGQAVGIVGAHLSKPYFDSLADEEAERLTQVLRGFTGPMVLAGDFNSAAWAGNIDELTRAGGLIPPPYYPATWPVRLGPFGVPIDNMWTRGPLFVSSIHSLDDPMGSNHRGIMAEISLADPTNAAAPAPAQ